MTGAMTETNKSTAANPAAVIEFLDAAFLSALRTHAVTGSWADRWVAAERQVRACNEGLVASVDWKAPARPGYAV